MRALPKLALAAALILLPQTAAAQGPGYRWHTAAPGESIQYGIPDTDDRGLRIDCAEGKRLEVMGTTSLDAESGPTTVTLAGGGASKTYRGQLIGLGDGINFDVVVGKADPVIKALLAGKPVTVTEAGNSYTIPGKGAAAPLARLLKACNG